MNNKIKFQVFVDLGHPIEDGADLSPHQFQTAEEVTSFLNNLKAQNEAEGDGPGARVFELVDGSPVHRGSLSLSYRGWSSSFHPRS